MFFIYLKKICLVCKTYKIASYLYKSLIISTIKKFYQWKIQNAWDEIRLKQFYIRNILIKKPIEINYVTTLVEGLGLCKSHKSNQSL